jgi:hypothetical protein
MRSGPEASNRPCSTTPPRPGSWPDPPSRKQGCRPADRSAWTGTQVAVWAVCPARSCRGRHQEFRAGSRPRPDRLGQHRRLEAQRAVWVRCRWLRLTVLTDRPILRGHHEERAMNGTSTRRTSTQRSGGWCKPERRRQGMDPGASGPNVDGIAAPASRLRRRAPAIQGSADRSPRRRRLVGHESAATPNEGGTAEGTTFRPGTNGRF